MGRDSRAAQRPLTLPPRASRARSCAPRVLKTLCHKNIMSFYDWWYDSRSLTINFITEVGGGQGGIAAAAWPPANPARRI